MVPSSAPWDTDADVDRGDRRGPGCCEAGGGVATRYEPIEHPDRHAGRVAVAAPAAQVLDRRPAPMGRRAGGPTAVAARHLEASRLHPHRGMVAGGWFPQLTGVDPEDDAFRWVLFTSNFTAVGAY